MSDPYRDAGYGAPAPPSESPLAILPKVPPDEPEAKGVDLRAPDYAYAIGHNAVAHSEHTIAIGHNARATGVESAELCSWVPKEKP